MKSEIRNLKSAQPCPLVTYDPALIEALVRSKVDAAADADQSWINAYRDELDDIYERSPEERESLFASLDRRYFQRVGIPAIVEECLAERAGALPKTCNVTMLSAQDRSEEGADVNRAGQMILRFRTATLADSEKFRRRLRREIVQAADCFNPEFGHAPELLDALLPSERERIRAALTLLWALTAQIRLCAEEPLKTGATAQVEKERLDRLAADLRAALCGDAHAPLAELLQDLPARPPAFGRMLEFCRRHAGSEAAASGICDLCRFPSEDVQTLSVLPDNVRRALTAEFTSLQNMSHVCARCAERSAI